MFGLGMPELIVIMVIVLLLFGGSRLPGIASGLGGAINSFKKALKGDEDNRTLNADNAQRDRVPTPSETTTTTKQG